MTQIITRKLFVEQLDDVRTELLRLGGLVCEAVPVATACLLDSDLDGARRLIEADDVMDTLTLEIEERCYQLLVLQSPMAGDLRIVVTALRLASEIERCGDIASNIAKAARRLYYVDLDPKLRGMIVRMSDLAIRLFTFALGAYADADEGRAAALDDFDDELDNLHRAFIEAIFESHRTQDLDLRVGVQLALVGRFYERLGDHAVNIGERVRYQVSGWVPEQSAVSQVGAEIGHRDDVTLPPLSQFTDGEPVIDDEAERRRVETLRRDFVANIGHELRTPVGAMAVLADTLRTEVEELDGVEHVPTVLRLSERLSYEASRLGRTIDDLLELSRIEAGELPDRSDLVLGEIVDASLERTAAAAELAQVTVDADIDDGDATLSGDRRQLVSALANLIDNAVKYSEVGGVVDVTAHIVGSLLRITVRDHGIGIPDADQARIFERFYRVDRARRRDTGGTGLGLAIVRHVALNHGGSVEVTSGEGEGATFTLFIPVDVQTLVQQGQERSAE